MEETLPSIVPANLLTFPEDLLPTATINQAKIADVQISNQMLLLCQAGVEKATSISALCKLIDTTMSVVERRRKLLCLDYGAPSDRKQNVYTEPLED